MIIPTTAPDRGAVNINIDAGQITAVVSFAVGVGAAAITFWARVGRPIKRLFDFLEEFRGDWSGVPDRPGVPGRHGVMLRLASIEHELKTNGGESLRDAVKATQTDVAEIRAQVQQATVIALPVAAQPANGGTTKGSEAA